MIDTHAHLQDEKMTDLDSIVQNAKSVGVNKIVCASSDLDTSIKAIEIANKYSMVYATVGIHPEEANKFEQNSIKNLKELAKNKKVVAIGEIGLDYYHIFATKEKQKEVFIKQIDLAYELGLPVVLHSREATGDMLEIIRNNLKKLTNGVCFHCFNMSEEILKEINGYGFYISIGGIVTFKNANNILQIAKVCDIDKLMLETDAPYLTPVPHRSKTNEPKYVVYTAEKIASLRNMTLEELDDITTKNAIRFFNLKD